MIKQVNTDYSKHKKIIAIDPGKEGGIVVFSVDDNIVIDAVHMPSTPQFILQFLTKYKFNSTCFLEKVGGIPNKGGASSMFNFGKGFGYLEMALICNEISTVEVTPQKWQKELQTGTKGQKTTTQWKTKLMEIAQRLFPYIGEKFNLKNKQDWLRIADALLILQFALQTQNKTK